MIRLRQLHRSAPEQSDLPPADDPPCESDASNSGVKQANAAGQVAAVDREIEFPALADIAEPFPITLYSLRAPSASHAQADQETPLRQPPTKSMLGRFLEKVSLTSTVLGLFVAVLLGAVSWYGLNYANYYARMSYELALYQACRTYEVNLHGTSRSLRPRNTELTHFAGSSEQHDLPNGASLGNPRSVSARRSPRQWQRGGFSAGLSPSRVHSLPSLGDTEPSCTHSNP